MSSFQLQRASINLLKKVGSQQEIAFLYLQLVHCAVFEDRRRKNRYLKSERTTKGKRVQDVIRLFSKNCFVTILKILGSDPYTMKHSFVECKKVGLQQGIDKTIKLTLINSFCRAIIMMLTVLQSVHNTWSKQPQREPGVAYMAEHRKHGGILPRMKEGNLIAADLVNAIWPGKCSIWKHVAG